MLNQSSPILGCHPALLEEGMNFDLTSTLMICFLGIVQHITLLRSDRGKGRNIDACSAMREDSHPKLLPLLLLFFGLPGLTGLGQTRTSQLAHQIGVFYDVDHRSFISTITGHLLTTEASAFCVPMSVCKRKRRRGPAQPHNAWSPKSTFQEKSDMSFPTAGWQLWRKNRKALGMQENKNVHVFPFSLCWLFFSFPPLAAFHWKLRVIINVLLATPDCRCGRCTLAEHLRMIHAYIYLLINFLCLTDWYLTGHGLYIN